MNDASESYELPVNERVVGELVEDPETGKVGLLIDGQFLGLSSLAESLESLVGFQLAIEAIDTSA